MLMIFLALTFGQEVGWCPYRTSHLTNNDFTILQLELIWVSKVLH
jgi:hypothetical protein